MSIVASVLVAIVAAIHVWILLLEMVLWQKPIGLRTFRLTAAQAAETAKLAANQGLESCWFRPCRRRSPWLRC